MIYAIFLIGLSMLLSTLLQAPIRRLALRFGAVDQPAGRKRHQGVVPRWGGVGIGLAVLLTWVAGSLLSDWLGFVWETIFPDTMWFGLGALGMLLIGMVDDVTRLRAAPKALAQALCAFAVWHSGIRVEILTNPFSANPFELGVLSAPITILWIMTVTNAFNLIDGLDGLASGLAVIAMAGFSLVAIFRNNTMILYAVAPFLGALLGFLPYNFPRAFAFLGDSGAYLIGYALAIFSLVSNQKGATAVVAFGPLLFVALPVADVVGTMLRRFVGEPDLPLTERIKGMFRPDRRHLHFLLVDSGISRTRTTMIMVGVSALVTLLGIGGVLVNDRKLGVLLGLVGLGVLLVMVLGVSDRQGGSDEEDGEDTLPKDQ